MHGDRRQDPPVIITLKFLTTKLSETDKMINKHFFKNKFKKRFTSRRASVRLNLEVGRENSINTGLAGCVARRAVLQRYCSSTHKHGRSVRRSFLHDTETKPQPNQLLHPAALPPLPQGGGACGRRVSVCGRTHNQSELLLRKSHGLWYQQFH